MLRTAPTASSATQSTHKLQNIATTLPVNRVGPYPVNRMGPLCFHSVDHYVDHYVFIPLTLGWLCHDAPLRAKFVLVPGVFDPQELAALHGACDELLAKCGPLLAGNPRIQLEPETAGWVVPVVRKLEPVIDMHPALEALAHDPRMEAAAADLLGEEVYLYEDKLNYKPPRIGSSYPLHQVSSWVLVSGKLCTLQDSVICALGFAHRIARTGSSWHLASRRRTGSSLSHCCWMTPRWTTVVFALFRARTMG